MDRELCKKCIHSEDAELHENSVCEICFRIDSIGNGANGQTVFIHRDHLPKSFSPVVFYAPLAIRVHKADALEQKYEKAS